MPSKAQTIIHLHRTRPELTAGEIAVACKTTEYHVMCLLRAHRRVRMQRKKRWAGVPAGNSNQQPESP